MQSGETRLALFCERLHIRNDYGDMEEGRMVMVMVRAIVCVCVKVVSAHQINALFKQYIQMMPGKHGQS